MSLAENVKRIVEQNEEAMKGSREYRELSVFYAKMKELGLVRKQEYTIPPLDTTGRRVRELMCRHIC
jgi:hypothetical protein